MADYKLMPKQITKEMANAFWEEYSKDRADDLLLRCYNAMYAMAPLPTEQPTFTVGTDLSDGKLTVVVTKHENSIIKLIHTEVIQLAEQQPDVTQLVEAGLTGPGLAFALTGGRYGKPDKPAPAQDELPTPDITTKRGYPAYSVELVSRLFAARPTGAERAGS